MSRTLFWYMMRDLLRVFLAASFVLAGIMSFGGLLKPLMQYGLSGAQASQMLLYFLPATQTYSLPIAALFATTMVYGRLSADNELTACRASGISAMALASPAMVLGLLLAVVSLASVCWVVPYYTLKVEKVVFASLADVVKRNIDRSHQIKVHGYTIYAERAEMLPPRPDAPDTEIVVLHSPMFCFFEKEDAPREDRSRADIPSEFYLARRAEARIRQVGDEVELRVALDGGVKVSRRLEGPAIGGIEASGIGPIMLPSPIKENPKFMNINQLKELYRRPLRSREIRALHQQILRQNQELDYLSSVTMSLRKTGECRFETVDGQTLSLVLEGSARRLAGEGRFRPTARGRTRLAVFSGDGSRQIRLLRTRAGETLSDSARAITIEAQADLDRHVIWLEFQMEQALVNTEQASSERAAFARPACVRTPRGLRAVESVPLEEYLAGVRLKTEDVRRLQRKLAGLSAAIIAETHGRAAFAISCLILVAVGCALGMMFRTANYLGAFALSAVPALLCIALIVTGQHVCEADPRNMKLGLGVMWGGNAAVLILGGALLRRLQRQ